MSLHFKIIIGLLLGAIWAIISVNFGFNNFTISWIKPFGDLFIKLLKLIAVPLVLFSVIKGVSSLSNIKTLGKIGFTTLGLYIITTLIAVSIGLLLVNTIKPGKRLSKESKEIIAFETNKLAEKNAEKIAEKNEEAKTMKAANPLDYAINLIVPNNFFYSLTNEKLMLHIIFFAVLFGIAITTLAPENTISVRAFVDNMDAIILKMMMMVMHGAPYFVFALMAGTITEMAGDNISVLFEIFKGLGWFSFTVLLGLGIMVLVIYPLIVKYFAKMSPKAFLKGIGPAQALAFSSSSSAATLPLTMQCVHENLKISEQTTSFVLPIGATINMDGTSLYQGVTVVFLAQFFGVELSFGQQVMVLMMSTLASIGSPAVPSAGLVMLIMVLDSVGLNAAWIALVFPIDRLLDMCRTVVNITGDAAVSAVIDRKLNISS